MDYNDVRNHMLIPMGTWIEFLTSEAMNPYKLQCNVLGKNDPSQLNFVRLTFSDGSKLSPVQKKLFAKELQKGPQFVACEIRKFQGRYTIQNFGSDAAMLSKIEAFLETEGPIWDAFVREVFEYLTSLSLYDALCLRQYQGNIGYTILNRYLRGDSLRKINREVEETYTYLVTRIKQIVKKGTKRALWDYLDGAPFFLSAQYGQDDTFKLLRKLAKLKAKDVSKLVTREKLDQWASDLNRIIEGAPKLPKELWCFRGTRTGPILGPLKGFTSTSTSLMHAIGFSNPDTSCCLEVYRYPKGWPAFLLLLEDEIVLSTNAKRRPIEADRKIVSYIDKVPKNDFFKGFLHRNIKFYTLELE